MAGAEWITQETLKWQKRGGGIYFVGLKIISQDILLDGGFANAIGFHNFFKNKNLAISTIYKNLDKDVCENCSVKLFAECKKVLE